MPDPSLFGRVTAVLPAPEERVVAFRAGEEREGEGSRYRALCAAISEGFCVVEIVFDEQGRAVDHRFVEVNPAFETQTGVSNPVGRRASEIFPGLEKDWFEVYGQVAKTGRSIRLTRESKGLGRIYEVQAFRVDDPALHHVGVIFRDITNRVRQEAAESASRQMLATIVDSIPACVCVIRGSDFRLELVNAAYQAIAPGKPMVGRTLNELWPETGQDFERICRQVLLSGEPYRAIDDLNHIRRTPDGPVEDAYFSWTLHRIELPDGDWGLLNTAWETTERKRVEEAARINELRYRHLVEQVPDGLFVADARGHYIDVNERGAKLLGFTRDEVLARSIADVILPEERVRIPVEVARFENGAIARSEWTFRRKDGSTFIGEVTGRRNSDGNLQAVLRDVTETKRIEDALRESEERFRSLADEHPLLIWVHDAEAGLSYVNRTYCEYFGIDAEHALGDRWQVLTHPDDGDAYAREFLRCVAERRPFHAQVRVRRADGEWRWVESWARPRFSGATFVGMIGSSADVTKRVEAENALKDADRRKDEFLALLAHELRNPLAPLRTGIELLRRRAQDEKAAEEARAVMQRQVEHMVRLIDDLLDVSRIARGKLELRRGIASLADILKSALETSSSAMEAGRHALDVSLPAADLWVEADAVRLAQVFSNLLNNAARYTPPGGRVTLRAVQEGADAVVTIEDSGVGIPADMLEKVFEPFVQVENRRGYTHGGLGLGLSLARSLIELHGGSIKAESAGEGRGSRFTVRLPLAEVALDPAPPASVQLGELPRRRVLVVDDNRDAADTLAALLEALGQEVRVFNDGHSALAALQAFVPDVALLDIGMPGMDGHELAARIRAHDATRHTRLVAVTGYGQASDRQRSREAGFDHHLVKPIDTETLTRVLAAVAPG